MEIGKDRVRVAAEKNGAVCVLDRETDLVGIERCENGRALMQDGGEGDLHLAGLGAVYRW